MKEKFAFVYQGHFSKNISISQIPSHQRMKNMTANWLKEKIKHDLSYERDEIMANNGGFPLLEEDDLVNIYARDRKDR